MATDKVSDELAEDRSGFADLTTSRRFQGLWNDDLRKRLRNTSLRYFELVHDPLEWASVEWRIDALTASLRDLILSGEYRAKPATVVRSAKGGGLTRPLSGLSCLDTLVLLSIVESIKPQIIAATQPWLSAPEDEEEEPESDWFHMWLVKDAERRTLIESKSHVVVTDVANFYPYVSLKHLEGLLLSETQLGQQAANLLLQVLRDVSPLHLYRPSPAGGLPQENYRCAEVLAHLYLRPIDDAFAAEGSRGEYWRHSDGALIAVDSVNQGEKAVKKFQLALEPIGLYPSSAKTRIIESSKYIAEQYIDLVEEVARMRSAFLDDDSSDDEHLTNLIVDHLTIEPRGSGWMRPMRRLLTLARITESTSVSVIWPDVLEEHPGTARWIAEYLTVLSLDEAGIARIFHAIDRWAPTCDDIPMIFLELLALAPNADDTSTRGLLTQGLFARLTEYIANRPRLACAAVVALGKHSTETGLSDLRCLVEAKSPPGGLVHDQASALLLGTQRWTLDQILGFHHAHSVASSSSRPFLQALARGEASASRAALGVIQPADRERPRWKVIRPRALFLAPILDRAGGRLWGLARPQFLSALRTNPGPRRDWAAERWLSATAASYSEVDTDLAP